MARKYTRDNRGRFASSGGGATARGGRLKTAAGNKRATQTMSAKGASGPAGTIAKGGNGVRGSVARSLAATRKPAAAPAKAAPKATGRTRAEATAAYKQRIRPARAAAARMAPADKPLSMGGPRGDTILGRSFGQIQAAQQGAGRALNGGAITGKAQKPRATQGDRKLLAQKGMKGLKAAGMDGVLDRLNTSKVRIGGKPKAAKPAAPAQAKAKPVARKTAKVTPEQRATATQMKKEVRSKNIQATRILQKMVARYDHAGSVKGLTATTSRMLNKTSTAPLRNQRGNEMSATKSKDLWSDRAPTRRLMNAAMDEVATGRLSNKRLDTVFKAAGLDYGSLNQGYHRAVDKAKAKQRSRRK